MGDVFCFPMRQSLRCPVGAWVQHPDYAGEALVVACDGPRRRIRLMTHVPDDVPDVEVFTPEDEEGLSSQILLAFEIDVAASRLRELSPHRDVGHLSADWQACLAFFDDGESGPRPAAPRVGNARQRLRLVRSQKDNHLDRTSLS